ncbi:CPBP family intramembrane glutamic endopeptidase [Nocardioides houyundeii]|uniref:CPBP family intramembrane glutamic endopeptidase n=1 Tax=Nocardioides houyundeii TaxID=2045452 RepID=UPI000C78D431|nr:CPBP family intramembrane glutamic endopeptidase [Nocardioides houyundeii]
MSNSAPGSRQAPQAPEELGYHQLHRGGPRGVWRPVVGVLAVALGTFLVAPLFWSTAFALGYALAGEPVAESMAALTDTDHATPATLAFLNLALASAIPLVWVVSRTLHGLRPRWLSSVGPGLRMRYFLVCLGLAFLALVATLVVAAALPTPDASSEVSESVNDFTTTTRDFLLVVLFLTPLQAAGEEYLFRGYLTQAFGGLFASRALAVLLPALLFALAHGGQDPPVFFDRFAFGVVAGILVIATGGLEAAIAMHVLNNFVAFGLALAFSDIGTALTPTGGSWWSLPSTLTQSLVYLALAFWAARRMGLRTTVEGGVLVAPPGRVYRFASVPKGA